MKSLLAAVLAFCALAIPASAQEATGKATDIEHYRLDNGLEVVLAPDRRVPKVVLDAIAQRYEQSRDELEEIFRDFRASPSMEPMLPDITAPALLLWGRKDRLIDVSSVAVWSKGIDNLRVDIWEGIGHMPMVEQPVRAARLYQEFLKPGA